MAGTGGAARRNGFTLIELMVVVAIVLIIAALSVSFFRTSRMATNEAAAVAALRSVNTAQVAYRTTYGSYAPALTNFAAPPAGAAESPSAAGLLDATLTSTAMPVKAGYQFNLVADSQGMVYMTSANPTLRGSTGLRSFCSDLQGGMFQSGNDITATAVSGACAAAANPL